MRSSKRWSITGFRIDPFRKVRCVFESRLERSWLIVFIVDPRIDEIREQQMVSYWQDGMRKYRYVDFVLIYPNGTRRYVEIKYAAQATQEFRRKFLADSRSFIKPGDRVEVLTELDLKSEAFAEAIQTYRAAMKRPDQKWRRG